MFWYPDHRLFKVSADIADTNPAIALPLLDMNGTLLTVGPKDRVVLTSVTVGNGGSARNLFIYSGNLPDVWDWTKTIVAMRFPGNETSAMDFVYPRAGLRGKGLMIYSPTNSANSCITVTGEVVRD